MSVAVHCPHCHTLLGVAPGSAGQTLGCPSCGNAFLAPATQAAEQATAPIGARGDTLAPPSHAPSSAARDRTARPLHESIGAIGRFQLLAALGQGTFGRVYRAFDPVLERDVALKVPRFSCDDPSQVERFFREARAAAQLRHPNIVTVFECGMAGDECYIASEFVDGIPLSARLEAGPVDHRTATQWVRDLASALAYAHAEGVVHRDIKPGNVMLGKGERPQLMDFGLAKRVHEDAAMTVEGSMLGTPAYMSPEQARGDVNNVGPASDQYGLGVVFYELLCGRRPFDGPPHLAIKQVLDEEPPSPRSLREDVPRDLDAICLKAMEKDPARRYATTGDLAADLDRSLRGEPVAARRIGLLERGLRWSRRQPALAAATAATAAALLLSAFLGVSLAAYETVAANALRSEQNKTLLALKSANERREEADAQRAIALAEQQKTAASLQLAEEQRRLADEARLEAERQSRLAKAETARAEAALAEVTKQTKIAADKTLLAAEQGRKADLHAAGLALRRGLEWCEKDIGRGMLLLARSLELLPAEATQIERVVRMNMATWGAEQRARHSLNMVGGGVDKARVSGQAPLAFSPDGRRLVTATNDRFAAVWDPATGQLLKALPTTSKFVLRGLAFSPDSRILVAGCSDKTALFWDVAAGAPLWKPMIHEYPVTTAVFCQARPLAVTGGNGEYVVRDLEGDKVKIAGQVRELAEPYGLGCAAFSPDGARLVWAERDRLCQGDYRGRRDNSAKTFAHDAEILDVAYGPDGKHVLTGNRDKTARLWDLQTGEFQSFQHPDVVHSVAFSPDGKTALTGCGDKQARLWDLATGMLLARPVRHVNPVRAAAFHPAGETFATGTIPASAQIWDVPRPLAGDVRRVLLWVQAEWGLELEGDESIRSLDAAERGARRERLLSLGGLPPS